MQKRIGIDLDEVLSETIDNLLSHTNGTIGNVKVHREDLIDYYIENIPKLQIDTKELMYLFKEMYLKDKDFLLMDRVDGACEKLIDLKNHGYELYVITAREEFLDEYDFDLKEYTNNRIQKHFPSLFSGIYFANHHSENRREKSELCKELGINIMVEDSPYNAIELAQSGIKTFLLEKPWNKHTELNYENIIRVSSWDEIII